MSDTIDWKARCLRSEDELGDWHATFPDTDPSTVANWVIEAKATANKAKAELDRVNRAHEECLDKRCQLEAALEGVTRDWQKTDRACSDMRAVIEKLWSEGMKAFWGYSNYADLQKMVGLSLSADAGASHFHRDEFKPLVDLLHWLHVGCVNHYPNSSAASRKDCRICQVLSEAKSKGLIE